MLLWKIKKCLYIIWFYRIFILCGYPVQDMTIAMSTFYYFIALSSFHFRPFKSFCFSYRLFRSLQSSFMRSNCARTPSRQSGSIFLYSPVRLRIVLLFSFICSERHTQSIRFCTSLSVS